MSTLIKPHNPLGPEPSRDEDPTGVRALLSAMPEPHPMPQYLVERINASLAAEQASRAAHPLGTSVTPLLATGRRRPRRLVLAIAGAAAAVTVVAVVGDNLFTADQQQTAVSGSAAIARTSATGATDSAGAPKAAEQAPAVAGPSMTPASVQIGRSGTRYTQAGFVAQAQALRSATLQPTDDTSTLGPAATSRGLVECLSAIGAAPARVIRADVAFYQGRPALIIITTTNGLPTAYVVTPQCSRTDPAVLRPATPLP